VFANLLPGRRRLHGYGLDESGGVCYRSRIIRPPSAIKIGLKPQQRRGIIMPQAVMDPEEVRRFAEELKRFNLDLQNRLSMLQARFASLGDSWQDQEHVKFADEFRQTIKALKKFMEISNQHTPYLLRKAQRIEEYLKQR
jgi:uncharacterized protein YukE